MKLYDELVSSDTYKLTGRAGIPDEVILRPVQWHYVLPFLHSPNVRHGYVNSALLLCFGKENVVLSGTPVSPLPSTYPSLFKSLRNTPSVSLYPKGLLKQRSDGYIETFTRTLW